MGARFSYNSGRSRRHDSARTEPSDDTVYVEDIEVDDDVPSDAGRRSRPATASTPASRTRERTPTISPAEWIRRITTPHPTR